MIPNEINQKIEQAFIAEMQDKYHLVYTDYNDSFNHSAETVHECMEKYDPNSLFETIDDWTYTCQYEMSNEIVDELQFKILTDNKYAELHPYLDEWVEDEENREHLRYCIYNRDESDPVSELIDRTGLRARVTQYTNYDCLPSNWDLGNTYYYQDYVKDIVDTLCLNPAPVKQTFIKTGITAAGNWTNLSYRDGKESVDYDAFAQELLNQNCYCHFVFMGMLPLKSLYEKCFQKFHKMIIPKGNSCGFYSYWQGGGSLLGMELKRDLELPLRLPRKTKFDKFELEVDERNCGAGYCIDDGYGLIRSAWGKEIRIVYKS
jgi:hypothetical protein